MKVLIVTEKTWFDSVISDIFTFGCLFGGFFVNHYCLGGSTVLNVFLCALILILVAGKGNEQVVKMSPDEALEYLKQQSGAA